MLKSIRYIESFLAGAFFGFIFWIGFMGLLGGEEAISEIPLWEYIFVAFLGGFVGLAWGSSCGDLIDP
tara:strand:- start:2530 stop:2733 length:204 start_codon:yes stop_codon:yes gene_type:complete